MTLQDILDERRIEFFCEGHRAFDLLRNKINLTSQYVSGGTVNYLDWRTIVELPEREKNINPGSRSPCRTVGLSALLVSE